MNTFRSFVALALIALASAAPTINNQEVVESDLDAPKEADLASLKSMAMSMAAAGGQEDKMRQDFIEATKNQRGLILGFVMC